MRVAVLKENYDLYLKGKHISKIDGFDIDSVIDIDRELDLDKTFNIDDNILVFIEYLLGIESIEVDVSTFTIDKDGNMFAREVLPGFGEFVVLKDSTVRLNKIYENEEV